MDPLILLNMTSVGLERNRYVICQNTKSLSVSYVATDSMVHQEYVDIWCQDIYMTGGRPRKSRMNSRDSRSVLVRTAHDHESQAQRNPRYLILNCTKMVSAASCAVMSVGRRDLCWSISEQHTIGRSQCGG